MPNHDPLRRAALKRAGLAASLAGLACTAPAAAQTLNVAETLAYINERCEGYIGGDNVVSITTGRVARSGERLVLPTDTESSRGSQYDSHVIKSFELRRVDIGTYAAGRVVYANFRCGIRDCVLVRARRQSERTYAHSETSDARIPCREADRVVNAFKHLQQLLGGRIADPVDPFAN